MVLYEWFVHRVCIAHDGSVRTYPLCMMIFFH